MTASRRSTRQSKNPYATSNLSSTNREGGNGLGLVPAISLLALIFLVSGYLVYIRLAALPTLPNQISKQLQDIFESRSRFELVRSPTGKDLGVYRSAVEFYMTDHRLSVIGLLSAFYVFLQAFAIPGPAILAILMAALFGPWVGGVMSMTCSLIGSSICYLMFYIIGRPILNRFFSTGLAGFKAKLDANRENLFYYFLFLRVTPILPNWFLNISSGNLGVSYQIFFFGTLLGLIPNAIILARAGVELATLGDATGSSGFDAQRMMGLLLIGILALLPIVVKQRFKSKLA